MPPAPGTAGRPSVVSTGVVPAGLSTRKASRRSHARSSPSRRSSPYSPIPRRSNHQCGHHRCQRTLSRSTVELPAPSPTTDHAVISDAMRAVILGVVEGVTEFLPVSSTGHLLLAERFFGLGEDNFWKSFAILIQLGAILAILAIYFVKLWRIALGMFSNPDDRRFVIGRLVGFLPWAGDSAPARGDLKGHF